MLLMSLLSHSNVKERSPIPAPQVLSVRLCDESFEKRGVLTLVPPGGGVTAWAHKYVLSLDVAGLLHASILMEGVVLVARGDEDGDTRVVTDESLIQSRIGSIAREITFTLMLF